MAEGRYYDRNGYIRVNVGGKLVGEHRVIMEAHLKRALLPDEVVHHRNEIKDDNRVENLEVQTRSDHSHTHARRPSKIELECPVCGASFQKLASKHRWNLKKGSQSLCSRSCANRWRGQSTAPLAPPENHGTLGSYFRCAPPRCGPCKKAMRDWKRSRRSRAK